MVKHSITGPAAVVQAALDSRAACTTTGLHLSNEHAGFTVKGPISISLAVYIYLETKIYFKLA